MQNEQNKFQILLKGARNMVLGDLFSKVFSREKL